MKIITLDTETTGLDPLSDKIIEIAGINLHTEEHFETLVNPGGKAIAFEAMATHHITELMAESGPPMDLAMLRFGEFIQQIQGIDKEFPILCAHNAKFDREMFGKWLSPSFRWLCTYKIALNLWPDAPRHTNQVLRYWLGLKPQVPEGLAPHRALYDIICTREILRAAMKLASLDELLHWSVNPVLLKKVQFGKHAGKAWSEVDAGYLRWCTQQADMNEDVLFTANYWLDKHGARSGGRRGW